MRIPTLLRPAAVAAVFAVAAVLQPAAPASAVVADGGIGADFNGDGRGDLAVGAQEEDVAGAVGAGAVHVLYGSPDGLAAAQIVLHQGTSGVYGTPENGDHFGAALAVGDLDSDGYDDLAVGSPGEDVAGATNAGGVHILYGGPVGLGGTGSGFFRQGYSGLPEVPEDGDAFGGALAVGDFTGDGRDDLAIGASGEQVLNQYTGALHVLHGRVGRLSGAGSQYFARGGDELGGRTGSALAAGDFDADGFDDLAVTALHRGVRLAGGGWVTAGVVEIMIGGPSGLSYHDPSLHQGAASIAEAPEDEDGFGGRLATGDFDADGYADLVIAAPWEDLGDAPDAGVVHVLYGSPSGVGGARDQLFRQGAGGIAGAADPGDRFGQGLAVGDFTGDGRDDLAIGAPYDDLPSVPSGSVTVLRGAATGGLSTAGVQTLRQGVNGLRDYSGGGAFGQTLTSADFNGDGRADLAAAAPHESVLGVTMRGVLHTLPGGPGGVSAQNSATHLPQSAFLDDTWFGYALAA